MHKKRNYSAAQKKNCEGEKARKRRSTEPKENESKRELLQLLQLEQPKENCPIIDSDDLTFGLAKWMKNAPCLTCRGDLLPILTFRGKLLKVAHSDNHETSQDVGNDAMKSFKL